MLSRRVYGSLRDRIASNFGWQWWLQMVAVIRRVEGPRRRAHLYEDLRLATRTGGRCHVRGLL
jgi:hypothetical protein